MVFACHYNHVFARCCCGMILFFSPVPTIYFLHLVFPVVGIFCQQHYKTVLCGYYLCEQYSYFHLPLTSHGCLFQIINCMGMLVVGVRKWLQIAFPHPSGLAQHTLHNVIQSHMCAWVGN